MQVALRAAGWQSRVHRLPDRTRPEHLAAIEVHPWEPSAEDLSLAAAIPRRRTDRRRFTSWPVPEQLREGFGDLAAAAGARLVPLDGADQRWRAERLAEAAAVAQALTPGAVAELHAWSGRHRGATDGVPSANVTGPGGDDDAVAFPLHNTGGAELVDVGPQSGWADDGTWLALLVTRDDSRLARLQAGEALSAVLLEATLVGLAGQPITQVLEVPELRSRVSAELAGGAVPQVLVRLGWAAATQPPVPETGRRPVHEVVDRWESPWPDPALREP